MEKRSPTYDLDAFKTAFAFVDRLNVTTEAARTAASLGFGRAEIVVPSGAGTLYVTSTADVVTTFLLLSSRRLLTFKEKDQ